MKKKLCMLMALLMVCLSAAACAETIELKVWSAQPDQALLEELCNAFAAEHPENEWKFTYGVVGEADAQARYLEDPAAAADVFSYPDDQIIKLVKADALYEVTRNRDQIIAENSAGAINAATYDGVLYGYPMTADNGYFLYYDASVLSAEDVQSMDTMLEKAAAVGKKFMMSVNDAWYIYSFYAGAGLVATLADDGINTVCNWNEAPGADVTQAILDIAVNPGFKSGADADIVSAIKDGSCCAAISGTWNASTAEEAWGEGYAATKLPTYTLNGEQVQMGSFSGYKLVGVNPHSANVGVAMMLADFITNEDNQIKRFNDRKLGPSNINANSTEAVQSAPAIAALAEQSSYATLQRVGANYWSSAASLGEILASGDTQGKTTQQLMDDAVAGITAPVAQ